MKTIWALFVGDIRRLTSNIVSILIVIGLVVLPGLFAWFNIAASWDPFGNTDHLKFAVVNTDTGYRSDVVPVTVTVGDRIVSELHENSELDWTFTSKAEAIDGTKSGKYYAAVIIPKDFSKRMMTFFSKNSQHAKLTYYTNQKKNALAPKVTGQGADQIAAQVNHMFSKTITSTALSIASQLSEQLNKPEAKQQLGSFSANIADMASGLADTASTLNVYQSLIGSAQTLLTSSNQLIDTASDGAGKAAHQLGSAKNDIDSVSDALDTTASTFANALAASGDSFTTVGNDIDTTFDDIGKGASDTAGNLRTQAGLVQHQIDAYGDIQLKIHDAQQTVGDTQPAKDALNRVDDALTTIIAQQTALRDSLTGAANDVDAKTTDLTDQRQTITTLASQAATNISTLTSDFNTTLKPEISSIAADITTTSTTLTSNASDIDSALDSLHDTSRTTSTDLGKISDVLTSTADSLTTSSNKLKDFNSKLTQALNSGDMKAIRALLGNDPDTLATTLAAPVQLKRKAVYSVENFGTAMTPFYTFIPLWVGSLLLALMLKTTVSRKTRRTLADRFGEPKPHQLFLGHFGMFATLSLAQSTFSCAGTLLFLRVHAVHPWLFMLNGWLSALTFAFIVYTLSVSFGTIGKAIVVIVLVMQISGSGGAYPLQVVPEPIQAISAWLPVTHAVQAARAAIAGIYDNDYWKELATVLLFAVPMLLLGLLLRKPLVRFNRAYTARIESTKLL